MMKSTGKLMELKTIVFNTDPGRQMPHILLCVDAGFELVACITKELEGFQGRRDGVQWNRRRTE